jgi:hypothetical protein
LYFNGSSANVDEGQIDYIVNDWLTIVAERYIVPDGWFNERMLPAWINKLQDFPLSLKQAEPGAPARIQLALVFFSSFVALFHRKIFLASQLHHRILGSTCRPAPSAKSSKRSRCHPLPCQLLWRAPVDS